MKKIYLNDILNLTEEEINSSKLALNMIAGRNNKEKSHLITWYQSDDKNRDVDFSYWAYSGKNRNFTYIGQKCFGFVQLPNKRRWLLVTVGEITSLPGEGACGHKEIEKYQGLVGRLIVEINKGNTFSRYVFNLSHFIYEAEVIEILPSIYEPLEFNGFENVHLDFQTLMLILKNERYNRYKDALSSVKGIYCLTDNSNGRVYIGSAYGKKGIAQRWEDYLNTSTGGNKSLINLYYEKGEKYFMDNFSFAIIEWYGKGTNSTELILKRESYWKNVFSSKKNGYNNS